MVCRHVARLIPNGHIPGQHHRMLHHRSLLRTAWESTRNDTGRKRIADYRILRRLHHILIVCRRYVGTRFERRLDNIYPLPRSERNPRRAPGMGRPRSHPLIGVTTLFFHTLCRDCRQRVFHQYEWQERHRAVCTMPFCI